MLPKPPDGYQDEPRAKGLMDRFVNGGQYEGLVPLPKRVDPVQADDFVGKVLQGKQLKDDQLSRCGEIMRFYDLHARAADLPKWLDKSEKEAPLFWRSLSAVLLLGDLGDDALQEQAAEYYRYLVSHRLAEQNWGRLIDLFFHLPASADAKWISDPMQSRVKALEPKIKSDQDAEVAYYQLKDLLDDRLQRVLKSKARKHEIMKLAEADRRRLEWVRWYLWLERNAYLDLRAFAVTMLQRECNATSQDVPAERFIHVFKLIQSEAGRRKLTEGDMGDLKAYVTSCARGVDFYHGQLDREQFDYFEKHKKSDQLDVLYWDPEESKQAAQSQPGGA